MLLPHDTPPLPSRDCYKHAMRVEAHDSIQNICMWSGNGSCLQQICESCSSQIIDVAEPTNNLSNFKLTAIGRRSFVNLCKGAGKLCMEVNPNSPRACTAQTDIITVVCRLPKHCSCPGIIEQAGLPVGQVSLYSCESSSGSVELRDLPSES